LLLAAFTWNEIMSVDGLPVSTMSTIIVAFPSIVVGLNGRVISVMTPLEVNEAHWEPVGVFAGQRALGAFATVREPMEVEYT
jgi:phosphate/sulfate permease